MPLIVKIFIAVFFVGNLVFGLKGAFDNWSKDREKAKLFIYLLILMSYFVFDVLFDKCV